MDVDLQVWAKTHQGNSPDGTEVVSSSLSAASDGSKCIKVEGHHESPALSTVTPSSEPVAAQQPRKAKARTAFSDKQMNALNERFTMQRYLTPVEMKTLAELTGLTYKQVNFHFYHFGLIQLTDGRLNCKLFMFKGENLVSKSQNETKEAPER